MFDHLSTVSRYMNGLGWTNYANDHEDANGQFEQNFLFDDALTTADRVIFFRYMVHTLAHEAGMAATFMPKPFTSLTGNGLHMNTSLWSTEGRNLFEATRPGPLRTRALPPRLPVRSRRARARPRPVRDRLPDGQQLQADGSRGRPARARRGPRRTSPTAATTAPS